MIRRFNYNKNKFPTITFLQSRVYYYYYYPDHKNRYCCYRNTSTSSSSMLITKNNNNQSQSSTPKSATTTTDNNNTNNMNRIINANICLLGLPGSGKGFYGRYLSSVWNIPLYSTSTILREHASSSSAAAEERIRQSHNNNNNNNNNKHFQWRMHQQHQQQQQQLSDSMNSSSSTNNNYTSSSSCITTNTMNSGQLMDCDYVSTIVHDFLLRKKKQQQQEEQQSNNNKKKNKNQDDTTSSSSSSYDSFSFLMDGYPRTIRQIESMKETWELTNQIRVVFYLNIPKEICVAKILGRRMCRKCRKEPNIAHVQDGMFHLPPTRPNNGRDCNIYQCNPTVDWYQRTDDSNINIITERIELHQYHIEPIIEYYKNQNTFIEYTPYNGTRDYNKIQQHIENWFLCNKKHLNE